MGTEALDKFLLESCGLVRTGDVLRSAVEGTPPRTEAVTIHKVGDTVTKTRQVRTMMYNGTGLALPSVRTEALDENDNATGEFTEKQGPPQVDKRMLFDREFGVEGAWHPWAPGGWGALGTHKSEVRTVVVNTLDEYQVLTAIVDITNRELARLGGTKWKRVSRPVYKGEECVGEEEVAAYKDLRDEYERALRHDRELPDEPPRMVPAWAPPEGSDGKPPEPKQKALTAKAAKPKAEKVKPEPAALAADEGFLAVTREDLLAALDLACKCVSRKQSLPILANVHLYPVEGGLGLYATDLEVGVTQRIAAAGALSGVTVPAHNLKAFIAKAPKKSVVQLRADDTNTLHIHLADMKLNLRGLPEDEYPAPIPAEDETLKDGTILPLESYTLDGAALVGQVGRVVHACSSDETRPILTGFLVSPQDGKLVFVGTNTHILALAELPCEDGGRSHIVPARVAALWGKVAAGPVTLSFGATHNFLTAGNTTITCRNIEGQFPNHEKITPAVNGNFVRVNRAALEAVLGQLHVVAAEDACRIRFDCNGETLRISADAQDTGTAGVTLPCEATAPFLWAQNGRYLKNVIAACGGEFVEFGDFTHGLGPGLWRNPEDSTFHEVVMPMQTDGGEAADLLGETCAFCGGAITYQDALHGAAVRKNDLRGLGNVYHLFCEEAKAPPKPEAVNACGFCGVTFEKRDRRQLTGRGREVHDICWESAEDEETAAHPPIEDEPDQGFGTCGFCGAPFGEDEQAHCTAQGMVVHAACLPAASRNEGASSDDPMGEEADDLAKNLAREYRMEKAEKEPPPGWVFDEWMKASGTHPADDTETEVALRTLHNAYDDLANEGYLLESDEPYPWIAGVRQCEESLPHKRTQAQEAALWYYKRVRALLGITPAAEGTADLFAEDTPEVYTCTYCGTPSNDHDPECHQRLAAVLEELAEGIAEEPVAPAAPPQAAVVDDFNGFECASCRKRFPFPGRAGAKGEVLCSGCHQKQAA